MSKNKIKILFIVPRYGSINRGVETFAKDLIDRLDTDLFEVSLLSDYQPDKTLKFNAMICKMLKREKIYFIDRIPKIILRLLNVFNVGGSADIEAFTIYLNAQNAMQNAGKFDIAVPLGGYWTYKLGRKLAQKVVSIGQSGAVKKWLKLSDCFIALTPTDLDNAKRIYPKLPSKIIPNGVDVSKFRICSQHRSIKRILCVAAFSDDKRHKFLFDAIMLLQNVELVCVGKGTLLESLVKHPAVKRGLVTMKSVDYNLIAKEYEDADVFTLASLEEAFGIVFIEAMAAGLPIVAHDGPRQRFVIGNDGFFCNTSEARQYASTLEKALLVSKSEQIKRDANERFAWDKIVEEYSKLFISMSCYN